MIANVKIVLPDGLNADDVESYRTTILLSLIAAAHGEVGRLVAANLHTMRLTYMQGIESSSPSDVKSKGIAWMELVGKMPNMLENGCSGWDLRETLLMKNPKRKQSKDGLFYAFIPFTHKAPGGFNGMPQAIYDKAKQLAPTVGAPGTPTKWGDSLPSGLAPKAKEHHVTDLYDGMYRMAKTYAAATQGQYKTFRTISQRNPVGWMHPGFRPRGYFGMAKDFVESIADAIVSGVPVPQPTMKTVNVHE